MFIPSHIVQSITDKNDRKIVFTDRQTNATITVPVLDHCVFFNGTLYDYWGHEVVFNPEIKEIVKFINTGSLEGPIIVVEKTNGCYSFAEISYKDVVQCCDAFTQTVCPYGKYSSGNHKVESTLECITTGDEFGEYRKIDTDFFTGTDIGEVLAKYDKRLILAYSTDVNATILMSGPGTEVRFFASENASTSDKIVFDGPCVFMDAPIIDETGTKCTGDIDGYEVDWTADPELPAGLIISIGVELTAEKLAEYYEKTATEKDIGIPLYLTEILRHPN